MKRKYFCDICGKEFDTERECEQHERKCSRVDALEKKLCYFSAFLTVFCRKLSHIHNYLITLHKYSLIGRGACH